MARVQHGNHVRDRFLCRARHGFLETQMEKFREKIEEMR